MVNSRNKGAAVEREFALIAKESCGWSLVRNLEQSRSGGHDLTGLPGWAIEVKARADRPGPVELEQMWKQAVDQAIRANARGRSWRSRLTGVAGHATSMLTIYVPNGGRAECPGWRLKFTIFSTWSNRWRRPNET